MIALGIDIGTTSICAVAADTETGETLKSITRDNSSFIKTEIPFEKIQDVDKIIKTVTEITDGLLGEFDNVCSIGVTGQMHGIVYTDVDGTAVSPLYIWQDARGGEIYKDGLSYAGYLSKKTATRSYSGYGLVTHFYNKVNGIVPENAFKFCTVHDYAVMRLTGRKTPLVHTSDAASFGAYKTETGFEREALKELIGNCDILPDVTDTYDTAGEYKGIPVSVAIGDNQASFIGSVNKENAMLVNIGTGAQVSVTTKQNYSNDYEIRPLGNGSFIAVGASLCGGKSYAILKDFFSQTLKYFNAPEDTDVYGIMSKMAADGTDELDVSTLFCGTRKQPDLRGSISNIDDMNFTPQNLTCGFLNGIAAELFELYSGFDISKKPDVIVGSGNAIRKNAILKSILEKTFGKEILIPKSREEAALGAMITGAVACKEFDNIQSAQQKIIKYEVCV